MPPTPASCPILHSCFLWCGEGWPRELLCFFAKLKCIWWFFKGSWSGGTESKRGEEEVQEAEGPPQSAGCGDMEERWWLGGSGSQQDGQPTLAEGALQLPALTRLFSLKGPQIGLGEKGLDRRAHTAWTVGAH